VNHPEYFLSQPPERGLVNPDNIQILISHLQCAAFELPFGVDESFGGHDVSEILEYLSERGFIHKAGSKWHWTSEAYPADSISLRSISSDNFVVVETTAESRILGEVDYSSAFTTIHEKAIYLHQGQQYYVHQLDIPERRAYVRKVDSITTPMPSPIRRSRCWKPSRRQQSCPATVTVKCTSRIRSWDSRRSDSSRMKTSDR
jgi:DEAD/DEAH box helicase domain-containing protein